MTFLRGLPLNKLILESFWIHKSISQEDVKDVWLNITRQGTSENNTIYEDRSIILSNQLAIIMALLAIVVTAILVYLFSYDITTSLLILAIVSFLSVPVFNHFRWPNFSRLMLSLSVPVYAIVISLASKFNAPTEMYEFFDSRIFILISSIVPVIIFPIENRTKIALSLLVSFLLLVLYDPIHNLLGVGFYQKGFISEYYYFINVVTTTSYIFLVGSVIFLKGVIKSREDEKEGLFEKLNAQNEELTYQNASIETQKQDLIRARDLIEAQKHELIEKNKELEQHIDEKTLDLIKTNKELIQYNNELRQFSYTISHNLRAPVASLIGLANIIGYDNLNDDDKLIVNHIKKSAENLDIVFKDLNKIIDIRSSLAVVKEKIVLSKEINEIKSSLKNEIKNSNIIFEDNLEIDIVFSIRPFINSILYNLISNAIKFKSRRRSLVIKISSKQEEENVIITVEDNGIGMDLETFKDDIFKMYKRFNQHTQGKGLGLYLVKLQAESLGGEIQVTSVLNKGTRFSLVLKNVTDLQDQTVLENEYARVFYDAFSNAAGIIWKREVSSEEYREMFIKNLEIFRSYKTPFWISDMRNVGPVSAEDQQWLIESIIPEAMEYGLKKIAMVIKPENIDERQKVYMEKLLQVFKANGVESSFFIDMEKGRNWLLN